MIGEETGSSAAQSTSRDVTLWKARPPLLNERQKRRQTEGRLKPRRSTVDISCRDTVGGPAPRTATDGLPESQTWSWQAVQQSSNRPAQEE